MAQEIVLSSEEDAFDLIQAINENRIDPDEIDLTFDGWPKVSFHITGDKYHNSITPSMMKGFIELQKGIHRAYAFAQYGTYNVGKLTDDDKKRLELAIGVEDGSSIFGIDLQDVLENGFGKAVAKMSSKELIFLIIALGAMYGGVTGYNYYLEDRKDARAAEVRTKEKQAQLDTMKFMSQQETERMKIMQEMARQIPAIDNVQRHAYDTQTEIFKRAGSADKIAIGDTEITGADAQLLTRNAQRKSIEVRLDGSYRLMEVNSSLSDGFKVKVRNIDTGDIFWARVQDTSLTEPNKNALVEAEWGKVPVKLKINARDLSGTISKALIVDVESLSEQEKEDYRNRHNTANSTETADVEPTAPKTSNEG